MKRHDADCERGAPDDPCGCAERAAEAHDKRVLGDLYWKTRAEVAEAKLEAAELRATQWEARCEASRLREDQSTLDIAELAGRLARLERPVPPERVAEEMGLMPDDGEVWTERCEVAAAVMDALGHIRAGEG